MVVFGVTGAFGDHPRAVRVAGRVFFAHFIPFARCRFRRFRGLFDGDLVNVQFAAVGHGDLIVGRFACNFHLFGGAVAEFKRDRLAVGLLRKRCGKQLRFGRFRGLFGILPLRGRFCSVRSGFFRKNVVGDRRRLRRCGGDNGWSFGDRLRVVACRHAFCRIENGSGGRIFKRNVGGVFYRIDADAFFLIVENKQVFIYENFPFGWLRRQCGQRKGPDRR